MYRDSRRGSLDLYVGDYINFERRVQRPEGPGRGEKPYEGPGPRRLERPKVPDKLKDKLNKNLQQRRKMERQQGGE